MRNLMIQIKPPSRLAAEMWAFDPADKDRPCNLLHQTVWGLWDVAKEPPVSIEQLFKMLNTVRARPFEMMFHHIKSKGKRVELVSCRRMPEAKTLRQLFADTLITGFGLPLAWPRQLRPHITLNYNNKADSWDIQVKPISWMVEEFLLVESVVGEKRHIEHGRWRLH